MSAHEKGSFVIFFFCFIGAWKFGVFHIPKVKKIGGFVRLLTHILFKLSYYFVVSLMHNSFSLYYFYVMVLLPFMTEQVSNIRNSVFIDETNT